MRKQKTNVILVKKTKNKLFIRGISNTWSNQMKEDKRKRSKIKEEKKRKQKTIHELEEKRRDVNNRPKRANNTISNMFLK